MSKLVQYEPIVDGTTEKFLDQTAALFSSRNAICDFTRWLQFYTADVIGGITYSKRLGFIDGNEDVEGICGYLERLFSYVAPVVPPFMCGNCSGSSLPLLGRPNSNS